MREDFKIYDVVFGDAAAPQKFFHAPNIADAVDVAVYQPDELKAYVQKPLYLPEGDYRNFPLVHEDKAFVVTVSHYCLKIRSVVIQSPHCVF